MKRILQICCAALVVCAAHAQVYNSFIKIVNTANDLQALNPGDIHKVVILRGYTNTFDNAGLIFYYDPISVTATNTTTVFKPTSYAGRWLTYSVGSAGTVTSVSIVQPAAGITQSGSPITTSGNITLALADDLAALEGIATTGYAKRTAANTWSTSSTIPASDVASGAALTKVDDTNVTLTLGGAPSTSLLSASSLTLGWSGTLSEARGGNGTGTYTTGDFLYASAANTLSKLGIGSAGQILTVTAGIPSWATGSAGSTGDWTFGTGTQTGPAAASILTVGALTLGTSAGNANIILDAHGTGKLQYNIATGVAGPFKIISDETSNAGTNSITWYPDLGTSSIGSGISLYGYSHGSKPGHLWLGAGGSGKVTLGTGNNAVDGTARVEVDSTLQRVYMTTVSTSSTVGAHVVGNGSAATSVGMGGGAVNVGASLAVGGHMTLGGSTSTEGAVLTEVRLIKTVTGIVNSVSKKLFTITVPNGAHGAAMHLKLLTNAGAGGAGGEYQSSISSVCDVVITRVAGANLVGAISTWRGQISVVVGGSVVLASSSVGFGAITGAAGASQTIDVNITVVAGDAADNHSCIAVIETINAKASGITVL